MKEVNDEGGPLVLVVEDDRSVQAVVATVLTIEGMRWQLAGSAAESSPAGM